MIVSEKGSMLTLVYQEDHGELSGEFARHWGNQQFERPSPSDSVLWGTRHHDRGWRTPDAGPLFDPETSRPLNFFKKLDFHQHVKFYRAGLEEVIQEDPYAGLMVSMHFTGFFRGRWGMRGWLAPVDDQERAFVDSIVQEEEERWIELKKALWTPEVHRAQFEFRLWHNYQLLQVWDLLSLYICQGKHEHEPLELSPVPTVPGGASHSLNLEPLSAGTVTIDPYPFDPPELNVSVKSYEIPDRDYESAQDVANEIQKAAPASLTCRLIPKSA